MEFAIPPARAPLRGRFVVPPSKSVHQRALLLAALAEGPTEIRTHGGPAGDDVRRLERALAAIGRWTGSALGDGRESLALHLGDGATGFRFVIAAAALRPSGARTLVRGSRRLRERPHGDLVRALGRLGGRAKRRRSGAVRVLGGGLAGGGLTLSGHRSSQYASALLLAAPRIGGLEVSFVERPVSLPYLRLTIESLRDFGVPAREWGLEAPGGRIEVPAVAPTCESLEVPPDASAAAPWWAAAALTGGEAEVAGLRREGPQPDLALLRILEAMGARLQGGVEGAVRVVGPATGLRSPGEVSLRDAPDLLPLVAVLAARARGTTRIHGAPHARIKESDRIRATVRGLVALGATTEETPDGLVVTGGALRPGTVRVRGDHRLAFAFGVLGLVVPGVVLQGAESVAKSHPAFLADLARAASGAPASDG